MKVGVVGLNYKSSDLNLRELLAKACQRCFGGESPESARLFSIQLSTCNRTEIYFSANDLAEAHSDILHLLREEITVPFEHKLYSYFGEDCFAHLAMVTAGLDSVVLAETEILRQVKQAYENACLYRSLPSCIHFLFQKCFKIGKYVRSAFPIAQGQSTLQGMVYYLSQLMFAALKSSSVLFIGNSEINRKIIAYFKLKAVSQITLCTRALHSAQEFGQKMNVKLVDWSHLPFWPQYDLVICGTNQHNYLILPEQLTENYATKLIVDLSLPRNVNPALGRHPQLQLFNIEELGHLIDKGKERHKLAILQADEMIREAVTRQLTIFHNKEKKAIVCA